LQPWRKIFSIDYWKSFFNKYIIPRLKANISTIVIDQNNQKLNSIKNLLVWDDFIHDDIIEMFVQIFFPKWINMLERWIKQRPDADSVLKWYEGWKKIFSAKDYIKNDKIKAQFAKALTLITNNF
jgi:hypothetical protein